MKRDRFSVTSVRQAEKRLRLKVRANRAKPVQTDWKLGLAFSPLSGLGAASPGFSIWGGARS
ncbi:MAG: hypothetical protein HC780_11560 [Leptolyngbyaceae cyanobacterium CSU_1_3]|nr:hypothetical protein [Leptolyngbyaceae cyanobacterium CSU_1_3]